MLNWSITLRRTSNAPKQTNRNLCGKALAVKTDKTGVRVWFEEEPDRDVIWRRDHLLNPLIIPGFLQGRCGCIAEQMGKTGLMKVFYL